jgi:hypothetical protein|tara:strand:+ start:2875 stop:3237 length:363 start_codon:yes stop_codon:yes gene_type:complete
MRFADIFGKGLVGALTGIDLTDMVMKGGLVGAATGMKTPGLDQDLLDLFDPHPALRDKGDFVLLKEKEIPFNERSLKPYHKDYNFTHGFGDYDGDGFYKGDLGGGPMTEAEKRKIINSAY